MEEYEDIIKTYIDRFENITEYPYGVGLCIFTPTESYPYDYGGAICVSETVEGVIFLEVWSGLGFDEYSFRVKIKDIGHFKVLVEALLGECKE